MKKLFFSSAMILVFALYVLYKRGGEGDTIKVVAPSALQRGADSPSSFSATSPSSSDQTGVTPLPAVHQGGYKDGTYTGNVADAYYGNLQVEAVIRGGKIADVIFLQFPNDRRTSITINTEAMPYLKEEAIQVQSATVDIISGATQTSEAFRESLQAALARAS